MKVVSFNTTKGGTGKTTLSVITLNALVRAGYKCLAIDMDMVNHSLSFYFNTSIAYEIIQQKNIFKVFAGDSIENNIIPINEKLDLLHSDVRLSDFRSIDNLKRLKNKLQSLKGYDYILIDTAPTFDNIIANVFNASDYLFIPVIPDVFNYQSVKYLFDKLSDLELNNLDIRVVFNQYDKPRSSNKKTFSNQIIDIFKADKIINPFICENYISKSSNIKKYINDRDYKISERKETSKQYKEILNLINNSLNLDLKIKDL